MKFILLIVGAFLIGSCGGADVSQTEDGFAAVKGIYSLKESKCTTNNDSTLIIQQNKALLSFEGGLNYYGRNKWSGYVVQKEDGSQKVIFTFRDSTPIFVGGNPSQSPDQPRDPEEEERLRESLVDKMECEAVLENEELQGNCQPKGKNNKKEACQFSFQRSDSEDEAKAKECLGIEDLLPADTSMQGTVEEEKVAFEEGQTTAQILVNDPNDNHRLDGGEGLVFFLTHEEKVTSGRSRRGIGSRRVEKPEPSLGIGMYLTKLTASAEGEGQCYSTEKDKDSLGGRIGYDLSQTLSASSAIKFVFKNPVKIESVAFYMNSFRGGTRIRGFFKATLEEGKGELVGRFMGNSRSIHRDDVRKIFGDDDEDDKKPAPK